MRLPGLAIAAVTLCACATRIGGPTVAPCVERCTLELTNATALDLDVRVTQRSASLLTNDHLAPGETREIVLATSDTPGVTVTGARSATLMTRLNVRVQCSTPTRAGDTFRSACRLASISATPGDSARDQPARGQVQ